LENVVTRATAQSKGEAAYRYADAQLGVPAPRVRKGWRSWPVISWLLNGRTPTLWTYSRLCLLLGLISLVAGLTLGMIAAFFFIVYFKEGGPGFSVSALISALTFSTPGALFIVGSGALAYLAARNDREAGHEVVEAVTEAPPPPIAGIVPNMDLGEYEEHKNDDPAP